MNSSTENSCSSTPSAVTDRLMALACWSLMNSWTEPFGIVEVLDDRAGVEVGAERVVDRLDGVGDVLLGVRQQVGDLRGDERADGGDEQDEQPEDPEQDQRRRRAPPPAPAGQPVDAGLDGEGQEHRDGDEHEQAVQAVPEEAGSDRAEEAEPEHDHRRHHPAGQATILLGPLGEDLLGQHRLVARRLIDGLVARSVVARPPTRPPRGRRAATRAPMSRSGP